MSSASNLTKPTSKFTFDENEKPKRNLSAYNLFFQCERAMILRDTPEKLGKKKSRRSHGKIGFASLARTIAARWKTIDSTRRKQFEKLAAQDKTRYQRELKRWKETTMPREDEDQPAWENSIDKHTAEISSDILPLETSSLVKLLQELNSSHLHNDKSHESIAPEATVSDRTTKTSTSIMTGIPELAKILDDDCVAFLIGY